MNIIALESIIIPLLYLKNNYVCVEPESKFQHSTELMLTSVCQLYLVAVLLMFSTHKSKLTKYLRISYKSIQLLNRCLWLPTTTLILADNFSSGPRHQD
jgi:hypothetical protein